MRAASFLFTVFSCLALGGATVTLDGHMYTIVDIKDKIITNHLLFEVGAKSVLHCAALCNLHDTCLTFTFDPRRRCRARDLPVTSCTEFTSAPGAKSFTRRQNRGGASEVAEALKCEETGVKQLIVPSLGLNVEIYCDNDWLVFLKRQDGSVDFYRNWVNYICGFGSASGEYWLGLENLHQITQFQTYDLRVDLQDWEGIDAYALYSNFSLAPAADFYRLNYGAYVGGEAGDSLSPKHKCRPFSTMDADHDENIEGNCAMYFQGGWWYGLCHEANLCGDYKPNSNAPDKDGVSWKSFRSFNSLQFAQMKIRPEV